jgi:hypothetical protein
MKRKDFRPVVYIAHPYTNGHVNKNVRRSCEHWLRLLARGFVIPHNPLWSHMHDLIYPMTHEAWMRYDLSLFEAGVFDAVFAPPSEIESSGVAMELKKAEELGIPVFTDVWDLNEWAIEFKNREEEAHA